MKCYHHLNFLHIYIITIAMIDVVEMIVTHLGCYHIHYLLFFYQEKIILEMELFKNYFHTCNLTVVIIVTVTVFVYNIIVVAVALII